MNISEPFIRKPVATVLLTIAISLMGIIAYWHLPIASLPILERPTITVFATMPGASANTVASALTAPLESQLGLIAGLRDITSSSVMGQSRIVLEFNLDKDIDDAAGSVEGAINAAGPLLPKNLPRPPIRIKANPSGFPIIGIALTSDAFDIPDIYTYADTIIAQKLSQIEGVARVLIGGAGTAAVRIRVSPRSLADMHLSLEAVRTAVGKATVDVPTGDISDGNHTIFVSTNEQLFNAAEFQNVVVGQKNGAPILLRDVAKVYDGTINDERAGWFNDKRAIILYVVKQPDANVVQTVDEIIASLPQLERWIPSAIKLHVVYDRTLLIRAAIADVRFSMALAIVLVVSVIAIFLRRFWATIIPSITIPVSIAITLVVIYFLGFSLDNISLMALTIATGFVIDDAVIIIENTTRLIQAGESPFNAALKGTQQIGFTVVSITAALIAALIPILFMPDIVGRLFREFGLTLVVAIAASAIVSLTLTPMMCAHMLGPAAGASSGWLDQAWDRTFSRIVEFYSRSLDWTLRSQWAAFAGVIGLGIAVVWLYTIVPKGFLPTQDTGVIRVRTVAVSNTSFQAMEGIQTSVSSIIKSDPAVADVASFIGNGVMSVGTMLVSLKPLEVRRESVERVIARLRQKLAKVPRARTFFTPAQDINLGRGGVARYQYSMTSLDYDELVRWARIMLRRIKALPQVTDVVWNYEELGLQTGLVINRDRAARAGITIADIDNTLDDWFGQRQIATIRLPINFARVVLEVDPQFRENPSDLRQLLVSEGVPVDVMTTRQRSHSPMWVRHDKQLLSIGISFNTPTGVSIGQAQEAIRVAEVAAKLPGDIRAEFVGEAREAEEINRVQPLLFLGAIIAIYIVLGMLYESYAHPLTILSTLPSATCGALLAIIISRTQFTLITIIACILLVGIVMKNAIMMVDFALDAERQSGMPATQAIRQAARLRFRPILMTTLASLMAALPLAFGAGAGSELRQPLGIALVGGLLLSQFVTLYTTPVIYLTVDRLRSWVSGPSKATEILAPEVAAAAPADTFGGGNHSP